MMEPVKPNDENFNRGVSPQELKDAGLDFSIFKDPSAKKLCESEVSQIEHVMNIVGVTCNVVDDFHKSILEKYPNIKPEQIALPEGYVSNASDYHGDLTAFLSQALFAGAITIDKNRLVAVDLDTGKVYSTLNEITELHMKIEKGELKHYDEDQDDNINNRIVYLPYTEINPNFKGRINFLGDYLDRGAESQFILGYIEYLSQLNKQTENPINMKFFLGNHDVPGVCGGARKKIMPSNSCYENVITRMLYNEDIFEVCDVVKDENGNFNSYSHTLFTILNLPEMFNLLKVFLDENANIEDYIVAESGNTYDVDIIKDEFPKAQKYFFDKFMNADEKSLPKDYVNLRNKIKDLTKQLKNLQLRTKQDGGLNCSECFALYDKLTEIGFLDEDFFYLKNILGKATFTLHANYGSLPALLGATSSDLGLFFGERPQGSDSVHINSIEEVEVCGKIRSIMFPKFTQHFGHTPYSDNHFKFSPHLRNYDIFMSGGYNQTQNSKNTYPADTANISKLKFIYSKRNEDNNVLLTPSYYIFRDKNQRILSGENFRKIDIVDENEKEFIDKSITLDYSTKKMIDMFSANFSNKDKNLDKDNKFEKDVSNDNDNNNNLDNDNDHDFHDDSNSGNNSNNSNDSDDHNSVSDNDGKPKPDAPKIKLQPLSQEITPPPTENKDEQIKLQNQYKIIINSINNSLLDKSDKNYFLSIINHPKMPFEEKLFRINKQLRIIFNNRLSHINVNSPNEKTPYLDIFEKFPVEDKFSALNFYIKIEQEYKFYDFINKSKMTEEEKTKDIGEFKKLNPEEKKSFIDLINKIEQQNELNDNDPTFFNPIPPLEPGDEIHI